LVQQKQLHPNRFQPMAPSMEGGFLPPLGLKISLTFGDERKVQEVLNTQFQLFTAEEDIQSFLLDQVRQLLQSCMKFSGGSKDAEQIHQKLQGLQTLSRTGVANLHPAPKTCLFLGNEAPVRRTNSDPERSKRERCVPPTRSAKSEETLTAHEQSTLMGGLGPGTAKETKSARSAHRSKLVASLRKLWNAEMERRKESERKRSQQSHSQECRKEKVVTTEDLIWKPSISNQLLPTIDEQPEGSPSTTDYSDGDESEGSDDFADFAEVPEDLPALAPPIAGVVNHTPAH